MNDKRKERCQVCGVPASYHIRIKMTVTNPLSDSPHQLKRDEGDVCQYHKDCVENWKEENQGKICSIEQL